MPRKLLFLLLLAVPAFAQYTPASGWCEQGNNVVVTVGVPNSTTLVQQSYPSCNVTVNISGGGLATIYSNATGAALANPFTASANGVWTFYAAPGIFTVTLSGGGIPAPFSYNLTISPAAAVGTGTVTSVATTSPITGGTITTTGTIACATCTTAAAALTSNNILLGGGGQAMAALGSLGSTTTVLHGNGAGAPSFAAVGLTTDVTGALPIANGGSGAATQTAAFDALSPTTMRGDLIVRNATNNVRLALGSNGQFLESNGTDAIWAALTPPITSATTNCVVTAASATTIQTNTNCPTTDSTGNVVIAAKVTAATVGTANNCLSSASPAVCGSAAAGSVALAAGGTTLVVNTSAVTANSQIFVQMDTSLGARLSVTCNADSTIANFVPVVTARTAATSFTITVTGAVTANPACMSYFIVN
jgi:hypothetical protein